MSLDVQVLPSGDGLSETPNRHVRSPSHFKTPIQLYKGGGGQEGEFQGPCSQGTRCHEWDLSQTPSLTGFIKYLIVSHSRGNPKVSFSGILG